MKKGLIFFCALLLIAAVVRLYNFERRINFGLEQAISLMVSGDYVKEKFSLLGLPSTQRTTSDGHIIYFSPLFNYGLVPLLLISNYDPVIVTIFFVLVNLVTGCFVFLIAKNLFGYLVGLVASFLYFFNDYMIYHSMFVWIVNLIPLLSVGIFWLILRLRCRERMFSLLIGLLGGVSLGLDYMYLFTLGLVFFTVIWLAEKKLSVASLFIVGVIISNTATLVFDIKHDFYHLRSLVQYLVDTLNNPGQSNVSYYHFLQFWPMLAIIFGYLFVRLYKRLPLVALMALVIYTFVNLTSPRVSFENAVGMSGGLSYLDVLTAAKVIASDQPKDFNVASTFDFDTRAHPLRYLLKFRYGIKPLGVEQYTQASTLYVFAPSDYDFRAEVPWEIEVFRNGWRVKIADIGQNYSVFKLSRLNSIEMESKE